MIGMSESERRQAFSVWLRTGRMPHLRADGVELKFNPYHDPRNGQFTFAPGGPRSLDRVITSHRRRAYIRPEGSLPGKQSTEGRPSAADNQKSQADTVEQSDNSAPVLIPANFRPPPRGTRGNNSRAFEDPMTLEQVFPGLRSAPGGAILSMADGIFDITGPMKSMTTELTLSISNKLIEQIRAVDPTYRYETLGFPTTLEGQINQINDLRFERAASLARLKGKYEALQVEVIRYISHNSKPAYEEALARLKQGRLRGYGPTERLAIGNYIDRRVMNALAERLQRSGIHPYGKGPVKIQRRDYTNPGAIKEYRNPDVHIQTVKIDLSLYRKDLATHQVRDFFRTKEATTHVAIVRPAQLGEDTVYIIVRPED